jgi:hypothetical protein
MNNFIFIFTVCVFIFIFIIFIPLAATAMLYAICLGESR